MVEVTIGKLKLKNPVILASGTAGFGEEIKSLIDLNNLGAIATKTITLNKREGNPPPRRPHFVDPRPQRCDSPRRNH